MQATDVMTTSVVSVHVDTSIREIASLLLKHRISAVPVVDAEQRVLGIVSESDLMRRPENDTYRHQFRWLEAIFSTHDRAEDYIKSHGMKAGDVMTRNVVTVKEDTPLHEIARLLEGRHIKRVPVTRDGRLVGIVSRSNLLHGLVAKGTNGASPDRTDDRTIRDKLMETLSDEVGLDTARINLVVVDGVAQIWGIVDSAEQKKAAQIAAETMPGIKAVENHLGRVPAWVTSY